MRNIDSNGLHEIIGEFAPLIGVAMEKTRSQDSEDSLEGKKEDLDTDVDVKPNVNILKQAMDESECDKSKVVMQGPDFKVVENNALDLTFKTQDEIKQEPLDPDEDIKTKLRDALSRKRANPDTFLINGIVEKKRLKSEYPDDSIVFVQPVTALKIPMYTKKEDRMSPQLLSNTPTESDPFPLGRLVIKEEPGLENETPGLNERTTGIAESDEGCGQVGLLYDVKTVNNITYYQCKLCPLIVESTYLLSRHLITHGEKMKPHKCDQCSKAFGQKSDLVRHMNIHNETRNFKCSVCGKAFKRSDYLTKHERQYCGVMKPHKCQRCHKGFEEENQLLEHTCACTNDGKSFSCEHCKAEFETVDGLKHNTEKPYTCDMCGKGFSRNHNLMTHMWIHNQEKQHTCQICAKTFTYFSNLQVHLRVHRNERPYICKQCDKGFLTSSDLRRHQRTHSGEKPYKCKQCPAEYARKERLIAHLVTHVEQGASMHDGSSSENSLGMDDSSKDGTQIFSTANDKPTGSAENGYVISKFPYTKQSESSISNKHRYILLTLSKS
ncbi:ZN254-like protein [Mya arenaria]|uniref:ZN254-like protein n=1 Tax=Mya arenaria TaxID=6604 RepID=A0ABY7FNW4_MYAAR|nr:ZN254-like protein [Mya arenaria]